MLITKYKQNIQLTEPVIRDKKQVSSKIVRYKSFVIRDKTTNLIGFKPKEGRILY